MSSNFFKIKPSEFSLNSQNKKFEIRGYSCSRFITSMNLILQGEWGNTNKKSRKALLIAIDMKTGKLIGEESIF